MGAFQKLLERYNECNAAEGDYFKGGLEFHLCTINKSAHTKKKSGNLFNELCISVSYASSNLIIP